MTLRLLKEDAISDNGWKQEPIDKLIERTLSNLHDIIVRDEEIFPAATFGYCFYSLSEILKKHNKYGQECVLKALAILSRSAQIRSEQEHSAEIDAVSIGD